jgi:hypothetical protein
MKLKAALVGVFVAGLAASVAVAGPHVGAKKKPKKPKVTMCHLNGSKKLVTIKVAKSAVKAHLRRGDKMGACPKPKKTKTVTVTVTQPTTVTVTQPCTTTTTTTSTTTTGSTSTSTTTTSSTTITSTSTSTSTTTTAG